MVALQSRLNIGREKLINTALSATFKICAAVTYMNNMEAPDGFIELVKAVMKEPVPCAKGSEIWEKFVRVIFISGTRSDPEISFLIAMLKNTRLLDLDYINSVNGEKWRDEISAFLRERLSRISDDDSKEIINSVINELFRLSASVKGSARFFRDRKIIEKIDALTATKDSTKNLIEEIVNSEDVSGVRYTKVIMWLHTIGRGKDFAPPSRYTKDFINKDIGPYYQFYDDDTYFMNKMCEITSELNIKNASVMDVSRAAFFYRALKSMLPQRSKQSKLFTPRLLLKFMKSSKLTFASISEMLSDSDRKYKLMEKLNNFIDRQK